MIILQRIENNNVSYTEHDNIAACYEYMRTENILTEWELLEMVRLGYLERETRFLYLYALI